MYFEHHVLIRWTEQGGVASLMLFRTQPKTWVVGWSMTWVNRKLPASNLNGPFFFVQVQLFCVHLMHCPESELTK